MLYSLARSALFKLDPEVAHDVVLKTLARSSTAAALIGAGSSRGESRRVMGLDFANPVGLAAGLDKNGDYIDALGALGFGFLEIGTVTPRAQPGNPRPRMFRLVEREALINRLGFNNDGLERLLANVGRATWKGILGINIGKNFDTPLERAADDYLACLDAVYAAASYVTVNISSPNTKNLRDLQSPERLGELLGAVMQRRDVLAAKHSKRVPMALKIAPDLDDAQIEAIAALALEHRVDALIATNTTVSREEIAGHALAGETGGLSGRPLFARSTAVLAKLAKALAGRIPLIGVGGILSGEDARAKVDAGASLVQVYTGFVYQGPTLIAAARRALRAAPRPGTPPDDRRCTARDQARRAARGAAAARGAGDRGGGARRQRRDARGRGRRDRRRDLSRCRRHSRHRARRLGCGPRRQGEGDARAGLRARAPGLRGLRLPPPRGRAERARAIAAAGLTAIAFELVRDARGGQPILAPMSRIAGRMAIAVAKRELGRSLTRVLVLGAGPAGTSAAEAARAAGAEVTILRRATATPEAVEAHALAADLVVGAVFAAGAPTPKLLPRALVRRMKRGALIVDISIEEGGVAETSRPTTHEAPVYVEEGVLHYCVGNMPAGRPEEASAGISEAALPYVLDMGADGVEAAVLREAELGAAVLLWQGRVVHPIVASETGLAYTSLSQAALA
jgi:dihydroorotate dehydrogenase